MIRLALIWGCVAAAALGCGDDDGGPAVPAADTVRSRIAALAPVANIGHRGTGNTRAGHPFPENSLSSFAAAMADGADGIELDVELTSDGRLVVMHDDTLDRTTDCSGCVSEFTLEEVIACRHLDGDGNPTEELVPTLAETYAALPPTAMVNVEMKVYGARCVTETTGPEDLARAAADEVRMLGVTARTFFSSFDRVAAATLKQENPDLYSALLYTVPSVEQVSFAIDAGLDAIHPLFVIPVEDVEMALAAGLQVNTWTVNQEADMIALIDRGATAIITDEPGLLDSILASRR